MNKLKHLFKPLITLAVISLASSLPAQEVPQVSSSSSPLWYRIQLSSWADGANRAQRYLSDNGTKPHTISANSITNADNNLWRLEGSSVDNIKLVSRNGNKELYSETGKNDSPLSFAEPGNGSTWNIYANNSISETYYIGLTTNKVMRINAGGEAVGSFGLAWGVGLYNENDKASAWKFARVYSTTVNIETDETQGSAYIGSVPTTTSAEIMSETICELHAVPADGYIFTEWQQNGTKVSSNETYTVTIPTLSANTATTYTAIFQKDKGNRTSIPHFITTTKTFKIGSEAIIEVSCPDETATIYYTLDGNDPSTLSAIADKGKITLDTSKKTVYNIKIAAKSAEKGLSSIVESSYSIISVEAPEALLPIPNERQLYYMKHPHAAFIHYGMNTYTNKEWGTGLEDCSTFNPPQEINTDQWVTVLKECGFDRVVLTGKHHDGFCLWPSKANPDKPHTIAQSPYKNGKGDLFEQLSVSCTKYGLDMGVYLSPWDAYEENVGGHYTTSLYNDFYNTQLNEVLSTYGRYNEQLGRRELVEVWLDGATGSNNPPVYDFNRFANTMRKHQPSAFVWIDNLRALQTCVDGDTCKVDGAWAMNESGQAPDPCWNKMTPDGATTTDGCKNKPNGKYSFLLEADVSIRNGWFYGDGGGLKGAVDLFKERYLKSIGRGIPLILNIPPDTKGEFAADYIAVLKKYKEYIDVTFKNNLIPENATATATQTRANDIAFAASNVLDNNYDTYWTMEDGQTTGSITVDFGTEKRFDIVQFQEYIPLGQRISGWKIEVKIGEKWENFATGTTVGFKRIVKGKEVQASSVRLSIISSLAVPLINSLAVYKSHEDLIDSDLPPAIGVDGLFEMASDFMISKETDPSVTVKVRLKERSEKSVSVYIATIPGTGVQGKIYQDKTETLVFEKGITEKEFTVNLINNENSEGDKDFYIEISNPSEDTTIGELCKTRIWVVDDENPGEEYTLAIVSDNPEKGEVAIVYPENVLEKTITSTTPVQIEATPKEGYNFVKWVDTKDNSTVSTSARYIYENGREITLKAYFDETYPIMTRTFSTNSGQENRYLRSITTEGTQTPIVFDCKTLDELPYTPFLTSNIGKYVTEGALINKRQTPIEVNFGTESFKMTFLGWTGSINGNGTELNWTQQAYFIDWNKDGKFTGTNEISAKSSNTIGDDNGVAASFILPKGYTRTISIPVGQAPGIYRMRIVYYEPESNYIAWQNTLFTTTDMRIRNGISYDLDVKIVKPVSIEETADKDETILYGMKNSIVCHTCKPAIMTIYSPNGLCIKQLTVSGEENIPIKSGLYIVNINGRNTKVAVR